MQQLQQMDWCEQQIKEKQQKKQLEKEVNDLFDKQTIRHNEILHETQTHHNRTRTENEKDTDRINLLMAQEKRDRELEQ